MNANACFGGSGGDARMDNVTAFPNHRADLDAGECVHDLAELDAADQRIEKLEAALRFYADASTYEESSVPDPARWATGIVPIHEDQGEVARAALRDATEGQTQPLKDALRAWGVEAEEPTTEGQTP